MIETVLALIPDYGLIVVFVTVALAGLALPAPASVLTLTAGSFAAVGDLSLTWVIVTAFAGVAIGDQIAFMLAKWFGQAGVAKLARSPRFGPVVEKSEGLLKRHGALAVFISHTVLSPTCPYVTYLSGAGGLPWLRFTLVALVGAALWACAYVGLGYVFATQLEQVATIISNFFGVVLAICIAVGAIMLLRNRWNRMKQKADTKADTEKETP
jgi:membrane protein DedA with SNARE-associated domain